MFETKKRILNEALVLFAVKGYDGVSMSDIAAAVGIKASSIYKHYAGKEEIFSSIVKQFEEKTGAIFNNALLQDRDYRNISGELLTGMIQQTFRIYAEDTFLSSCRRLFMISAFSRPDTGNLYAKYFIEMPMQYQAELFTLLQREKIIDKRNAEVMAYHFYTPILILLQEYDYKKLTVEMALEKITVLVNEFMEVYQL